MAYREDSRFLVAVARANAASSAREGAHGRPKHLGLQLARAHRDAMNESGLTQEQMSVAMGVARQQVARFGSDDSADTPSAKHIARAPDAYVDAFMRSIAAIRVEHGHGARQWLPAPDLVHGDDDLERSMAVIGACANATRAARLLQKPTASVTELRLVERELTRNAEASLEAAERVRRRLRDAVRGER